MEDTKDILNKKRYLDLKGNNDNNVNNKNDNNDSNAIDSKYALDRSKFTPNTKATTLAEEIATYCDDLDNYAAYLSLVNKLGVDRARTAYSSFQGEVEEKAGTDTEVRSRAKYLMWKFRKGLL